MNKSIKQIEAEYRRLIRQLAKTGWIGHGYVQVAGRELADLATSGREKSVARPSR